MANEFSSGPEKIAPPLTGHEDYWDIVSVESFMADKPRARYCLTPFFHEIVIVPKCFKASDGPSRVVPSSIVE